MSDTAQSTVHNADLERERLLSLINSMADGVIALDQKTQIVAYNGAALNILDMNSSMLNKPITTVLQLYDKTNKAIDMPAFIRDIKTGVSYRDYSLHYRDGSVSNLYLNIAPVHLGFGKEGERGYVLLLRDITKEKSLEEERDEFISVVSHELRTPIAIAEGNISNAKFVAEKSGDLSQIKTTLNQAHEQITFLSGLINDLATLSRAERGNLSIDIEPINTHALIEELAKDYEDEATKKNLQITTQSDPALEILKSSKLYVKEILQNFITNAIKYTEQGGVTIGADLRPGGVLFSVKDTGIGISKSDQQKIFHKFFRSEDYRTRKNSGTGLGLYVAMKLAKILHAEIGVASELHNGSTFNIFIPSLQ